MERDKEHISLPSFHKNLNLKKGTYDTFEQEFKPWPNL